jgi:predicted secreted hydrolase
MYKELVQPLESVASSLLDGVAAFLSYGEGGLRDAPTDGRVTLPEDLFAKPDVQTEWWYYTGHCITSTGREFGFELVFFKRRTDGDRIGVLPVSAIANPMYFAHFAISDIARQSFRYDHIRSFDKPLDTPVKMSSTSCDLKLGDWTLREVAGKHVLHATLDGLEFDAILEPTKPIVLNGDNGSGIAKKGAGSSVHFSFTRMNVNGRLRLGTESEEFTGSAWMDREFGSWAEGEWDWFSIQFDDETELMIYQFKTDSGKMDGESTGTFVDAEGNCKYLKRQDFDIEATGSWTSGNGSVYPSGWHVRVPSLDIDITIKPLIDDQELNTTGSTMVVYWEGACSVTGTRSEKAIDGKAYVELVGYDRSHESVGISDFLFGKQLKSIRDMVG